MSCYSSIIASPGQASDEGERSDDSRSSPYEQSADDPETPRESQRSQDESSVTEGQRSQHSTSFNESRRSPDQRSFNEGHDSESSRSTSGGQMASININEGQNDLVSEEAPVDEKRSYLISAPSSPVNEDNVDSLDDSQRSGMSHWLSSSASTVQEPQTSVNTTSIQNRDDDAQNRDAHAELNRASGNGELMPNMGSQRGIYVLGSDERERRLNDGNIGPILDTEPSADQHPMETRTTSGDDIVLDLQPNRVQIGNTEQLSGTIDDCISSQSTIPLRNGWSGVIHWNQDNIRPVAGRFELNRQFRLWDSRYGRTGRVMLCRDTTTGSKFMVKQYYPRYFNRFEVELPLQSSATCFPCPLGLVWNQNLTYVLQEYLDGIVLSELLKQRRSLTSEEVNWLNFSMLRELDPIHQMGIIHRNLTPEHIIISREKVKLYVVGGSSLCMIRDCLSIESRKTLFTSPEMARGQEHDGSTDIYSLGIVLHRCLSGSETFFSIGNQQRSLENHLFQIGSGRYLVSDHLAGVPQSFHSLINAMTNPEMSSRWSASDLMQQFYPEEPPWQQGFFNPDFDSQEPLEIPEVSVNIPSDEILHFYLGDDEVEEQNGVGDEEQGAGEQTLLIHQGAPKRVESTVSSDTGFGTYKVPVLMNMRDSPSLSSAASLARQAEASERVSKVENLSTVPSSSRAQGLSQQSDDETTSLARPAIASGRVSRTINQSMAPSVSRAQEPLRQSSDDENNYLIRIRENERNLGVVYLPLDSLGSGLVRAVTQKFKLDCGCSLRYQGKIIKFENQLSNVFPMRDVTVTMERLIRAPLIPRQNQTNMSLSLPNIPRSEVDEMKAAKLTSSLPYVHEPNEKARKRYSEANGSQGTGALSRLQPCGQNVPDINTATQDTSNIAQAAQDDLDISPPAQDPSDIIPPAQDPSDITSRAQDPSDITPPAQDPSDITPTAQIAGNSICEAQEVSDITAPLEVIPEVVPPAQDVALNILPPLMTPQAMLLIPELSNSGQVSDSASDPVLGSDFGESSPGTPDKQPSPRGQVFPGSVAWSALSEEASQFSDSFIDVQVSFGELDDDYQTCYESESSLITHPASDDEIPSNGVMYEHSIPLDGDERGKAPKEIIKITLKGLDATSAVVATLKAAAEDDDDEDDDEDEDADDEEDDEDVDDDTLIYSNDDHENPDDYSVNEGEQLEQEAEDDERAMATNDISSEEKTSKYRFRDRNVGTMSSNFDEDFGNIKEGSSQFAGQNEDAESFSSERTVDEDKNTYDMEPESNDVDDFMNDSSFEDVAERNSFQRAVDQGEMQENLSGHVKLDEENVELSTSDSSNEDVKEEDCAKDVQLEENNEFTESETENKTHMENEHDLSDKTEEEQQDDVEKAVLEEAERGPCEDEKEVNASHYALEYSDNIFSGEANLNDSTRAGKEDEDDVEDEDEDDNPGKAGDSSEEEMDDSGFVQKSCNNTFSEASTLTDETCSPMSEKDSINDSLL